LSSATATGKYFRRNSMLSIGWLAAIVLLPGGAGVQGTKVRNMQETSFMLAAN
jgi:hypothetical protein